MITIGPLRCPSDTSKVPRLSFTGEHTFCTPGLTLLEGPNGVGKTTLLRIIAGIETDYAGDKTVHRDCRIRYVPTEINDLLMPWYSVSHNAKVLVRNDVHGESCLDEFRCLLEHFFDDRTDLIYDQPSYKLSAGERAAVACACALACRPSALLLDESFAHMGMQLLGHAIEAVNSFVGNGGLVVMVSHHLPQNVVVTSRLSLNYHEES